MSFSTVTRLAFRATSLGALALTILAASANNSFAQIAYTTSLPTLGGSPFIIPEALPVGATELMTVNIAGAVFFGLNVPGEVDITEPGPNGIFFSDRILFDNTGAVGPLGPTAMITFLSDDENEKLPDNSAGQPYPLYPLLPVTFGLGVEDLTTNLLIFDTTSSITYTLTALMISDDDFTTTQFSDSLTLSVPEPSTVCLAGLGLAALAGLAYRRRRTTTSV